MSLLVTDASRLWFSVRFHPGAALAAFSFHLKTSAPTRTANSRVGRPQEHEPALGSPCNDSYSRLTLPLLGAEAWQDRTLKAKELLWSPVMEPSSLHREKLVLAPGFWPWG